MPLEPARILALRDKYESSHLSVQPPKGTLKAQRVLNIISSVQVSIASIEATIENTLLLSSHKQTLEEHLRELSGIFHTSTQTEQKRCVEHLIVRDPALWNQGVEIDITDQNTPITKSFPSWEEFNKLPASAPRTKNDQENNSAIIVREKILLAIYGISLIDLVKALRKTL